jgi:hypothetical protein
MLSLKIGALPESFDNAKQEFVKFDGYPVEMEHSLFTLSKWEQIWEKPFLDPGGRTAEETVSYIRQMITTPDVPEEVFSRINNADIRAVNDYIDRKMTATTIQELPQTGGTRLSREIVTAEVMYYWMVALNIPFECQYWHLNRLITLVKVINLKQQPPKKMSRRDIANQQRQLNEQRRAKFGTQG